MKAKLRPEAMCDAISAQAWYERKRRDLGDEFVLELDAALQRISAKPLLYALVGYEVRRARTKRFPYHVYFRVIGETIDVIAILHGRRSQQAWKDRAAGG